MVYAGEKKVDKDDSTDNCIIVPTIALFYEKS